MTPNQFRHDISNVLSLLIEADIALLINPVIVTRRPGTAVVCWPAGMAGENRLFDSTKCTVEEYLQCLRANDFSAALVDGALLQLAYEFESEELVHHRLCYVPCPIRIDEDVLRVEPIADVVEDYLRSGSEIYLRTPLRFDFDLGDEAEMHPASHLTLVSQDCRWAAFGPLSPGHFIRFVFKHFYPQLWRVHEFLRKWPQHFFDRTISVEDEQHLHIACTSPALLR